MLSQVNLRRERHRLVVSESSRFMPLCRVAGEISGIARLLAATTGDWTLDITADSLASIARFCLVDTASGPNRIAEASDLMRRLCFCRIALGLPSDLRNVYGLTLALRAAASGATDDEIRIFAALNMDQQTVPPLADLTRGLRRSDRDIPASPRRGVGNESPRKVTRWESPIHGESPTRGIRSVLNNTVLYHLYHIRADALAHIHMYTWILLRLTSKCNLFSLLSFIS